MQSTVQHPWHIKQDLPCLHCDYNLRGLDGPQVTCPECGQNNDLTDAYQWAPPTEKQSDARASRIMLTGFMLCCSLTLIYPMLLTDSLLASKMLLGFMALCSCLFFVGSYRRMLRNEREAESTNSKTLLGLGLGLMIPSLPIGLVIIAHHNQPSIPVEAPFVLFPGIAVSLGIYFLLLRLFPQPKNSMPNWMRYCDGIIEQHRHEYNKV
ncbi:MAG: hypothetical protein AAGI37_12450 [Planctomycetota bacterium]